MPAPKGFRPPAAGKGRVKGTPNKNTVAIKDMVVQALDAAGGADYLLAQAHQNPNAFLSLVAKLMPTQVAGEGGGPVLIITGVDRGDEKDV